jgi:hypothetical protein
VRITGSARNRFIAEVLARTEGVRRSSEPLDGVLTPK